MKKLLLSLLAFLTIGGSMQAQVTVTEIEGAIAVDPLDIEPGGQATAIVRLTTDEHNFRGVQFDLYLPEGITVKKTNANKPSGIKMSSDQPKLIIDEDEDPEDPDNLHRFTVVSSFPVANDFQRVRVIVKCETTDELFLVKGGIVEIKLYAAADFVPVKEAIVGGQSGNTSAIDISGTSGSDTWIQPPFTFLIGSYVLNEINDYTSFTPYNNVNVTMIRKIGVDNWNTLCLPFDMTTGQLNEAFGEGKYTIANYTGCESSNGGSNISYKFLTTGVTSISANKPCLIKLNDREAITEFKVNGVKIQAIPTGGASDGEFVGNYENQAIGSESAPVFYIQNNQFYLAKGKTTMKSFRGYFNIPSASTPSNVYMFVDGEPTGIKTTNVTEGEEEIYDISGRKVNNNRTKLQKGIYIINGQKEAVH